MTSAPIKKASPKKATKATTRAKKSQKSQKVQEQPKSWRNNLRSIQEKAKNEMNIDEILDLSIMTKTLEKTIFEKVQKHYEALYFVYLNDIELTINYNKMEIFDVFGFLELLSSFNISIKYASFHNFPSDLKVVKEIEEAIGKMSSSDLKYTVIDDIITVPYSALMDINESACDSMENVVHYNELVEENIQEIFKDHLDSRALKLELCSLEYAEFPRELLKILLRVLNPTRLEITFNFYSAPIFPQQPKYHHIPKFHFAYHSLQSIFNDSIEFCNIFMTPETDFQKNYVMCNLRVGRATVTVYGLRLEFQLAYSIPFFGFPQWVNFML